MLLAARELGNLLESLSDFAGRSGAWFGRFDSEKVIDGDAENFCDGVDLVRA